MLNADKIVRQLVERRGAMEQGIFSHPPSDWDEFQRRLGMWSELNNVIDVIINPEDEDDKL